MARKTAGSRETTASSKSLTINGRQGREDKTGKEKSSVSSLFEKDQNERDFYSTLWSGIKTCLGCTVVVMVAFGILGYIIANETEKRGNFDVNVHFFLDIRISNNP